MKIQDPKAQRLSHKSYQKADKVYEEYDHTNQMLGGLEAVLL